MENKDAEFTEVLHLWEEPTTEQLQLVLNHEGQPEDRTIACDLH